MNVEDFNFVLPKKYIANFPTEPRDHAKMLFIDKNTNKPVDTFFYDLPSFLQPGDVLVLNNTKVFPARLKFLENGKEREIFFLEKQNNCWKTMVRPGKRFKAGAQYDQNGLILTVEKVDEDGFRQMRINLSDRDLMIFLRKHGEMPVPPYIEGGNFLPKQYNTVYSKQEGSVAAPTAGLHFTKPLLKRIKSMGVKVEFVTLDVGLGTFMPIKTADSTAHKMHEESYSIDQETAARLNGYLAQKRRIIAVGTTSVRVLEDNYSRFGAIVSGNYQTDIFIQPGYKWLVVKGLITNFHLPKSTLIMLVAAFIGRENVLKLYEYAKSRDYRFYSFGDGMFMV